MPTPALDNQPTSNPYYDFLIKSFNTLASSVNEKGNLPFHAIESYIRLYELEEFEDIDFFIIVMFELNAVYRQYQHEQMELHMQKQRNVKHG